MLAGEYSALRLKSQQQETDLQQLAADAALLEQAASAAAAGRDEAICFANELREQLQECR